MTPLGDHVARKHFSRRIIRVNDAEEEEKEEEEEGERGQEGGSGRQGNGGGGGGGGVRVEKRRSGKEWGMLLSAEKF